MVDGERRPGAERPGDAASSASDGASSDISAIPSDDPHSDAAPSDAGANLGLDESIVEELSALIDDGRTYAQAEVAFQKTRAKLAGQSIGVALACIIVALILLHIAFLALAVGLVIALQPLVTIWGAIAIVVGGLLIAVGFLGYKAKARGNVLQALFAASEEADPDKAGGT